MSNPSLIICHNFHDSILLIFYIENIILTVSSNPLLDTFIALLHYEISMKDLGLLHYFLGIEVTYPTQGLILSQSKYEMDSLTQTHMTDCKPCSTHYLPKQASQSLLLLTQITTIALWTSNTLCLIILVLLSISIMFFNLCRDPLMSSSSEWPNTYFVMFMGISL